MAYFLLHKTLCTEIKGIIINFDGKKIEVKRVSIRALGGNFVHLKIKEVLAFENLINLTSHY